MFRVKPVCTAISLATIAYFAASTAHAQGYDRPVSWTGFYIGAHGGYAWSDIDFPGAPPHPVGPPRQTLEGGIIGAQIGYNLQIEGIVLGIEADVSKGKLNGTVRDGNYITQTDTIDLMGSVRGRLGLAMGPFMPYLTAGIMWDRATRGQQCPDPGAVVAGHCSAGATGGPFAPYNLTDTQVHQGYVWGGGIEYAIGGRWSMKLEGLWADMGEQTYTLGPTPSGKMLGSGKIEHDLMVVRFGVNARF